MSNQMGVVRRTELSPHAVELEVTIDLTDTTVAEFRAALYAELEQPHREVRLNLHRVRIINSAALGAILLFHRKAREEGKELLITQVSEDLRKTIVAVRLDRIIPVANEAPPTVKD